MSEQAERDAVRAAQDEARAKQLLDEVTHSVFGYVLSHVCKCECCWCCQAAAARAYAEDEARRRAEAEKAADAALTEAADAVC